MVYLDSSAIVKLVVNEKESLALRRFLRGHPERIACSIARTEVLRAVRHLGSPAIQRARLVLRSLHLVEMDDALLDAAGLLDPRILRSLDAVHLAAVQLVAPALDALVTYDKRMRAAALLLGLSLASPA